MVPNRESVVRSSSVAAGATRDPEGRREPVTSEEFSRTGAIMKLYGGLSPRAEFRELAALERLVKAVTDALGGPERGDRRADADAVGGPNSWRDAFSEASSVLRFGASRRGRSIGLIVLVLFHVLRWFCR
jgi:hypothetical protein